ncbi:MAG: glycosyltransferase [Acidimicrobiia bacterium]|nr:glycosyltransferase [Acidimicrobiia bacterium]
MSGRGARVVCLVPVRDAEADLPEWFASIERFADSVVALDDGSVDASAELLEAHPLVEVLLRNLPSDGHHSWNDSVNRNRLLEAAGALAPEWIISLDADEVIPAADADALRAFVEHGAVPGFAYGFARRRVVGDLDHDGGHEDRIYRLFAHRPGQRFPADRLHFTPVPTTIPSSRWLATDLRVQHRCWLTPERQQLRRAKYRDADPDQRWGEPDGYGYMEEPVAAVRPWVARRPNTPVLLRSHFDAWRAPEEDLSIDGPVLSVVVLVDDERIDEMVAVVDAVEAHACRHEVEVIVIASGAATADDVARLRPGRTVVRCSAGQPAGAVRNLGVRMARGDHVVCLDAPVELAPGALDALIDLHDEGHAVVTGATAPPTPSAVGWASWLLERRHASFSREPLLAAGGFDEGAVDGLDGDAIDRLLAGGQRAAHSPLVTYGHRAELVDRGELLALQFARGRRWGATDGWRDAFTASEADPGATARVRPLVAGGVAARWLGSSYERLSHFFSKRT